MNQAALHRLLAIEKFGAIENTDPEALFDLRLETNLSLILLG